jgi:hypothetical protein
MDPRERARLLEEGARALRAVEATRRGKLPPPDRENAALLRGIRDIMALAHRLEFALEIEGYDQEDVWMRDAVLSMEFVDDDVAMLRALAVESNVDSHALRELAELMVRYAAGEFMPPAAFFGIRAPEV